MSRFAITYCDQIGIIDVVELVDDRLEDVKDTAKALSVSQKWPWHTVNEVLMDEVHFRSIG